MTVQIDGRHVGVGAFASARILVRRDLPAHVARPSSRWRSWRRSSLGLLGDDLRHVRDHDPGRRGRADDRFVPSGSTGELLDQLGTETTGLGDMLVDNAGQQQALVRVEAIWALARPGVASDRPELLEGFDTVIDLVRRSVERRRPADADKAHKNLLTLIAAYDG